MSQYSEGQTHQVMDALEAKGFTAAQITALGQNQGGILDQLMLVFMGLATIVMASLKLALDKAFSPVELIGAGWSVWKGPAEGNGTEGDDDCVQEPAVVDFSEVVTETHLQGEETTVHGEEKMKRARASGNPQLGGKAFMVLWSNWLECKKAGKPGDSILERLYKAKKIGNVIYFFGITLRSPVGDRGVLYLCRDDGGRWRWDYGWLDDRWGASNPSLALASVKS